MVLIKMWLIPFYWINFLHHSFLVSDLLKLHSPRILVYQAPWGGNWVITNISLEMKEADVHSRKVLDDHWGKHPSSHQRKNTPRLSSEGIVPTLAKVPSKGRCRISTKKKMKRELELSISWMKIGPLQNVWSWKWYS